LTGNPELIEQYRQIHATQVYGNTSVKNLRFLRPEIRLLRPRSILDYGCGQSTLLDELHLPYPVDLVRYDPAIPAYAARPGMMADLLINIDVLEHIEEQDVDKVLADMASLSRNAIIIVDTKPAVARLPNGSNAHILVRPHDWWRARISPFFPKLFHVATPRRSRAGFKTWPRGGAQTLAYAGLRLLEDAIHYRDRALALLHRK
jgi:hypothetical protein